MGCTLNDLLSDIRYKAINALLGIYVAEHRKQEELPEELHGFARAKERRYGVVKLSIYNNM